MAKGLLAWALLAAALAVVPRCALADTKADRIKAAAEEFDAGRKAFQAKDYEAAAAHFENADRDAPAPEALRNAIRSRIEARQIARAATLAASALARYPNDKETTRRAKDVLAKADKTHHRLLVSCSPACTLLLDGKLTPFAEISSALFYLDPGSHTVEAGWPDDRNRSEPVEATAGKESSLSLTAPPPRPPPRKAEPPPPPPPPPPPRPPGGLPRVVFYSALGATAVLGGVTLWSALDMRSDPGRDQVRQDCAGKDESCPTYQRAMNAQLRTNVLLGVSAGALVATGVIAGFTRWSDAPPSSGRFVRPSFAVGQGWSLGAEGQF